MATRITLRDIAQASGLHYSTVSLALRNNPRIPAQTRNRVQKIARELGYRPDPMLSALATYRHGKTPQSFTGTLAWLNCHPQANGWRISKRLSQYYEGAREQAEKFGYKLEEFWYYEPGLSPRRLSQILRSRNITGLLITALTGATGSVDLDWEHFAGVLVGHGLRIPQLDCVNINQMRTCSKAITRMAALGYKRIALITSREHDEIVENQYSNAYICATEVDGLCQRLPILYAEQDENEKIIAYLHRERPDAIVCMPYYKTAALLAQAGYKPGELGVCLLITTGTPNEQDFHRMVGPGKQVGAAAVTLIDGMLRNNQCGIPEHPSRLLFEGQWVQGNLYAEAPQPVSAAQASAEKTSTRTTTPRHPVKTAGKPAAKSITKPVAKRVAESAGKGFEKSTAKPASKSTTKPAEKRFTKPATPSSPASYKPSQDKQKSPQGNPSQQKSKRPHK